MENSYQLENETTETGLKLIYAFDPEIESALASLSAAAPALKLPTRGDWKALRDFGNASMEYWAGLTSPYPDVQTNTFFTTTGNGELIELRWYTKNGFSSGSAVVFAHGGGFVLGDLDKYDCVISEYVHETGVPFLSVKYRLAPEAQGVTLAEDVFAGLVWLIENATELDVNPRRIAIMGDSAGGGIAAGVAILARDRKVTLAKQILIYPMLDDRNQKADENLLPFLTWSYDDNFTGWSALLGDTLETDMVSAIAAPARLTDFNGLAPAYIEVGELDIFRDEDISYAQQIAKARVPVELHVHPGAPHGYDRLAPSSKIATRAMMDRMRVIRSI